MKIGERRTLLIPTTFIYGKKLGKIKNSLSKEYNKCTRKRDYKKFVIELEKRLQNPIYEEKEIKYQITYYLLLTLNKLNDFKQIEKVLKSENIDLTSFYKLHKGNVFTSYIIFSIFFSLIQIVIINLSFNKNSIEYLIALFYVPLSLSILYSEYAMVMLASNFSKLYQKILNNETKFHNLKDKFSFLTELFSIYTYRIARMKKPILFEKKVIRLFLIILDLGIFILVYKANFVLIVLNVYFTTFLLFSSTRSLIGTLPMIIFRSFDMKEIELNIFAEDKMGGSENLFKIFGFSLGYKIIFLSTISLPLIIGVNLSNQFYLYSNSYWLGISLVILFSLSIIKAVSKIFSLYKNLKKQKDEIYSQIITVTGIKKKTSNEDLVKLEILKNIKFKPVVNLKRFLFVLVSVLFNVSLAIYSEHYKKIINSFYHLFFK